MTTHPLFVSLSLALDDQREALAIADHLSACAVCRAELHGMREVCVRAAALRAPVQPPDRLWPAVEARLVSSRRRRLLSITVLGLLVVLAVALSLSARRSEPTGNSAEPSSTWGPIQPFPRIPGAWRPP
jgi:predicted anti-sigma-YlaC factor YlaD